jgi:hypothetical protein
VQYLGVVLSFWRRRVNLKLTKLPRKVNMLLLIEGLISEKYDLVLEQSCSDFSYLFISHPSEISTRYFSTDKGGQRFYR